MSLAELGGRTAVVTGAASGIGFALAERFVADGVRVVLAEVEVPAPEQAATAEARDPAKSMKSMNSQEAP